MAIGDGIRRNIATVSREERRRFIYAILALDRAKFFGDGVSYWDKQNQIHGQHSAGTHGGPAFLTWHRELCNRLEGLIREVDPDLSLHYWDWTTDPRASPNGRGGTVNLMTSDFMDSAVGEAVFPLHQFTTSDPSHPVVWRFMRSPWPAITPDNTIITTGDSSPQADQYRQMRLALEMAHNTVHTPSIGGTITDPHTAFHDPFVFLLHSNVDRLFAWWQTRAAYRRDPNQVYGSEGNHAEITANLKPWDGTGGLRPWAPPENQQVQKNSKHPTVVAPPAYDTFTTHQEDWRVCSNCNGIYFRLNPGRCSATGGGHTTLLISHNIVLVAEAPASGGQDQWRYCSKCSALAYAGGPAGPCSAGGTHNTNSWNYRVAINSGRISEQHGWKYCSKCRALFFEPGGAGSCPAGGGHSGAGSFNYTLSIDAPGAYGQENWRYCRKCQVLAHAGGAPGACPSGGTHDHSTSSNYRLTHAPMQAPGQNGWRYCTKCFALHHNNSAGPCPAGGNHANAGSWDYILPFNVQESFDLEGGRWCSKCQAMTNGNAPAGACPGGGTHNRANLYRFNVK